MKTVYYLVGKDVYERDSLDSILKLCKALKLGGLVKKLGDNWTWKESVFSGTAYIPLGKGWEIVRIIE